MRNCLLACLFVFTVFGCEKSPVVAEVPDEEIPPPPLPITAPSVRSVVQLDFTGVSTVSVPKPASAVAGDLLILIMAKDGAQFSKPGTEEGWVRIVSASYGSGVPLIRAWWKKVTSSDRDHYVFATGAVSNSGRIDLVCIKDWNGSAPTAISGTQTSNTSFITPSIPAISKLKNDLLLTTVAVAAASGLSGVEWSNSENFKGLTSLSANKVTLATSEKSNLQITAPNSVSGNTFKATGMADSRSAAVLSFIIPAGSERPVIRVYRGGAARTLDANGNTYYLSSESLISILSHPSKQYDVRSIGENEVDKISPANLNNAAMYIQPGGPTIHVGWPYLAEHKSTIRNYVDNGGKFLGVCFGAYMFRNFYDGESFDLLPSGNYAYTYNSYPGATYDGNGADLVNLILKDHWGQGSRIVSIVGGCYFYLPGTVPDLATLATYQQPDNAAPRAAIRFSFNGNNDSKKGWIIGIGPHPEATPTWGGKTDPDGSDAALIEKSVTDLLSR